MILVLFTQFNGLYKTYWDSFAKRYCSMFGICWTFSSHTGSFWFPCHTAIFFWWMGWTVLLKNQTIKHVLLMLSEVRWKIVTHQNYNMLPGLYLVSLRLPLSFQVPTHNRINVDPPIESGNREDWRIPWTPLDIKAPLTLNGQLINHLLQKEQSWKYNVSSPLLSPNYLPTVINSVTLYLHYTTVHKSLISAFWKMHCHRVTALGGQTLERERNLWYYRILIVEQSAKALKSVLSHLLLTKGDIPKNNTRKSEAKRCCEQEHENSKNSLE